MEWPFRQTLLAMIGQAFAKLAPWWQSHYCANCWKDSTNGFDNWSRNHIRAKKIQNINCKKRCEAESLVKRKQVFIRASWWWLGWQLWLQSCVTLTWPAQYCRRGGWTPVLCSEQTVTGDQCQRCCCWQTFSPFTIVGNRTMTLHRQLTHTEDTNTGSNLSWRWHTVTLCVNLGCIAVCGKISKYFRPNLSNWNL